MPSCGSRHISRKIIMEGVRKYWGYGLWNTDARRAEHRGPKGPRAVDGVLGDGAARGSGERCELPHRGLGQSSSRHMVFIHSEYFRWSLVVVIFNDEHQP